MRLRLLLSVTLTITERTDSLDRHSLNAEPVTKDTRITETLVLLFLFQDVELKMDYSVPLAQPTSLSQPIRRSVLRLTTVLKPITSELTVFSVLIPSLSKW